MNADEFNSPSGRLPGADNLKPANSTAPTRRAVLRTALALGALRFAKAQDATYAYVGCYTTAQRLAHGDGIHVYRMDRESGAWTHVQHVGKLVNPSFLVMRQDQSCLYSVHGDETYASSLSIDRESGHLTPLNRAETGGRNGVHQAIDPSGNFLLVANYSSGSVSVMPVRSNGSLADASQVVELTGEPGPHRVEQSSSHPHQIVFDPSGRFVIVPDKGLDRVFVLAFDSDTGKLAPASPGSATARAGSGPHHAIFHPRLPILWVLNEISSTVTTYHWDAARGNLRTLQIVQAVPQDYTGENTSAEIAVSAGGRFVYCSNRGHDSIAGFAADPATGLLTCVGWAPSRGITPRFIGLDPSQRFMYAANEQSDTVVAWRVDATNGRLTPTAQVVRNASPVTIAFAG